jgi:hypothetical protein
MKLFQKVSHKAIKEPTENEILEQTSWKLYNNAFKLIRCWNTLPEDVRKTIDCFNVISSKRDIEYGESTHMVEIKHKETLVKMKIYSIKEGYSKVEITVDDSSAIRMMESYSFDPLAHFTLSIELNGEFVPVEKAITLFCFDILKDLVNFSSMVLEKLMFIQNLSHSYAILLDSEKKFKTECTLAIDRNKALGRVI